MLMGIIGLPRCGKSTLFTALSGVWGEEQSHPVSRTEPRIATVTVMDDRVNLLKEIYKPKKTTLAKIQYLLAPQAPGDSGAAWDDGTWNRVRVCDGFLHVVRNFEDRAGTPADPGKDFQRLEEDMIVNDLAVAEKRMERIELDKKRGKKPEGDELRLVAACREVLDGGQPLRHTPELAEHPALRGFTFLTAKPVLIVVNNDDEDESEPGGGGWPDDLERLVVRGRLEMDIASMPPDEAEEFRVEYHIQTSVLDRVIKASYRLLDRISFFTVLSDEVRAWTVSSGTRALGAAGAVHSDMEKGFIRAETLSFEDLKSYGNFQEAKKGGAVRLEGKEYEVKDGDIINFRFNV
ncbi:MAG: redox-regulated ATPase YchF [Deltaproteobacteria bacterium]|nr:redox-regulated ATPase YchF [Deltaproteobacteria bacterium]MBW2284560.1 redox-regulated ATPase YchF [Deltaproteobacteria bacterium]